ncbi:MAG TPA: flavodoxin family protein [Acidobacteriota bacterium]|nr:flavodoxin family protein [Acidobacteriota bacterium]
MRVLGIVGSPRKNGNTEILMREVLKVAQQAGCETEMFLMSGKQVAPCDACGACFQVGACVVKDDMQELYAMMERAQAIVFGSPVYFGSVSAQMKAAMDRMFAFLQRRALKDKVAGALVVTRRVGAINARSLLYSFCIAQGMVVAGGAIGYGREIGDVLTGVGGGIDMSAVEEARLLGSNVVQLAKRLGM